MRHRKGKRDARLYAIKAAQSTIAGDEIEQHDYAVRFEQSWRSEIGWCDVGIHDGGDLSKITDVVERTAVLKYGDDLVRYKTQFCSQKHCDQYWKGEYGLEQYIVLEQAWTSQKATRSDGSKRDNQTQRNRVLGIDGMDDRCAVCCCFYSVSLRYGRG